MRYMAPVLLLVAAVSAQNSLGTNKGHHLDIPSISREASGSVVSIVMSDTDGHPIAQGSGFLISKSGQVVTNYHVIKKGNSALVKLPDGAFFAVDGVLASDKNRDVAIIKAHGNNFRTLVLGDSDRLQVGEEVVAIGTPLSLESTVSNGIVSGLRTAEEEGAKFLQITAPISPGSSGGPLFNMAGEVVGITTSGLRSGQNLNFAIPINDVKPMLATVSVARALPNEPVVTEAAEGGGSEAQRGQPLVMDGFTDGVYLLHMGNIVIKARCVSTDVISSESKAESGECSAHGPLEVPGDRVDPFRWHSNPPGKEGTIFKESSYETFPNGEIDVSVGTSRCGATIDNSCTWAPWFVVVIYHFKVLEMKTK